MKEEPEVEVAYHQCISLIVERRFASDGYDKRVTEGFLPIGWPQVILKK